MTTIQNNGSDDNFTRNSAKTISLFGAMGSIKVASADTKGNLALFELTVPPHFRGMPAHWHAKTTEAFYLLDGTLAFTVEEQTFTLARGGFVLAPPYTVHYFWNPTAAPVTFLNFFMPGGFAELATAFATNSFATAPFVTVPFDAKHDQFAPPVDRTR